MMQKEFNDIIIKNIIIFINTHNLLGDEPSISLTNNHRKYIFGSNSYGHSLSNCLVQISKFNIFDPLTSFNYYNKNYLIKFNKEWNSKLFNILLEKFLHTQYEDLFFSSIMKIIPLNFCIENQPWSIVERFLLTKPLKSNGLPQSTETQDFFYSLSKHINNSQFNNSFFQFCQFNKSLIKRTETQEYLKLFLKKLNNKEQFSIFLIDINQDLTITSQDFTSLHINKKVLFSKFSQYAINKKQPVDNLISIFKMLSNKPYKDTKVKKLFIEQKEEIFPDLLIFISFSEPIHYSFEDYYLYLLDNFLNNKLSTPEHLETLSRYFFLNLNLPPKIHTNKQKTAKI